MKPRYEANSNEANKVKESPTRRANDLTTSFGADFLLDRW